MRKGNGVTVETEVDLAQLPDDLGLELAVDGGTSLAGLTDAVNGLCERVERRAEKTVVVLRLAASPDGDRTWPGQVGIQAVNRWERAVRRLERLAAVTITAAAGTCGGAALDLLLATDFRIAAPDLRLMLPVNDGHFWPGMSVFRLVQHVGLAKARQIVLWGTELPLRTALDIGLVDRVAEDLTEAVRTAAVLVGRISDRETALRRQLLIEAGSAEYDEALGVHLAACDRELRRLHDDGAADATEEPAS